MTSLRAVVIGLFFSTALLAGGCGGPRSADHDPSATAFLKRSALPAGAAYWRRVPGNDAAAASECHGAGGSRGWSNTGTGVYDRGAIEIICSYASPGDANEAYDAGSLAESAGFHWPNYEPDSKVDVTPRAAKSLRLTADEWSVGCGTGDPDGACYQWTFRARYGAEVVEFVFNVFDAPISFSVIRTLALSIERAVLS
jgi:hypothetical protein